MDNKRKIGGSKLLDQEIKHYKFILKDKTIGKRHLSPDLLHEVEGLTVNIDNNADEVDITSTEDAYGNMVLKLKDRHYSDGNGKGYVILRPDKSFKSQVDVSGGGEQNTIYEIRYDYDLSGNTVTIPVGCELVFNGGSLSDGIIALNNSCAVRGVAILTEVRFTAIGLSVEYLSDITIEDITLDGNANTNLYSLIQLKYVNNVFIKNVSLTGFNRGYNYDEDNYANQENYEYHVVCAEYCNNINISALNAYGTLHPEGPLFYRCNDVKFDKSSVSDKGGTYKLYTCLQVWYCKGIEVTNSYFYHNNTVSSNAGSTINFTAEGLIDNCVFDGGEGVDIGNERKESFVSSYITVQNCRFLGRTVSGTYYDMQHLIYGSGLKKHESDYEDPSVYESFGNYKVGVLTVSNCNGGFRSYIWHLPDSVKNAVIQDCAVSRNTTGALLYVNLNEIKESGVVINNESNIILNRCVLNCSVSGKIPIVGIASDASVSKVTISNCDYTQKEASASTNACVFCSYTTSEAANLYVSNNKFLAERYNLNDFATAGKIVIDSNDISIYDKTVTNSILLITRNTSLEEVPNSSILLKGNRFTNLGLSVSGSEASPVVITNNYFNGAASDRAVTIASDVDNLSIDSNKMIDNVSYIYVHSNASLGDNVCVSRFDVPLNMTLYLKNKVWVNDEGVDMTGVTKVKGNRIDRAAMSLTSANAGLKYYDTSLGIPVYWNGTAWVNEDGSNLDGVTTVKNTTAQRNNMSLTSVNEGFKYYDTTLHKYVLWTLVSENTYGWRNLDGSALS